MLDSHNMVISDFGEDVMQPLMGRNNLDHLGIQLDINSFKHNTTNYGDRLLSLCKSLNVHIVYGRVLVDSDKVASTCKNVSMFIVYVLVSTQSFLHIVELEVWKCINCYLVVITLVN